MLSHHAVAKSNRRTRVSRLGAARALCELLTGVVRYGVRHWRDRASDHAGCACGVGSDCEQCNTKRAFKMNTRACSA